MRVAVAGGTGFVGGAIATELARRGHQVTVLTRRPGAAGDRLPAGCATARFDVASDADQPLPEGTEALAIALAFDGYPMENPRRHQTFMEVDAGGTERLVRAAVRLGGVRHLVYVSGAGAAPDAAQVWFRAKWRAEAAVQGSGIAYTIIRPTWLYGPRDVALNRFLGFARWLPFVPLSGNGRQRLAPVFIDDLAALVADALVDPKAVDQVFELGGPETFTMRDILRVALEVAGLRRAILPAPEALLKLGAWPLQFLPRPPLTPGAVEFVNQPAEVDVAPLLARMPRRLTPLREGLATYLAPRPAGRGQLRSR